MSRDALDAAGGWADITCDEVLSEMDDHWPAYAGTVVNACNAIIRRRLAAHATQASISDPPDAHVEGSGQTTGAAGLDRDYGGRLVREAWVRWALTQPSPKPTWLVPYDELSEPDKEADRQIAEALWSAQAAPAPAGGGDDTSDKPPMPAHDYAEQWAADTLSGKTEGGRFSWGERNLAHAYLKLAGRLSAPGPNEKVTILDAPAKPGQGGEGADMWGEPMWAAMEAYAEASGQAVLGRPMKAAIDAYLTRAPPADAALRVGVGGDQGRTLPRRVQLRARWRLARRVRPTPSYRPRRPRPLCAAFPCGRCAGGWRLSLWVCARRPLMVVVLRAWTNSVGRTVRRGWRGERSALFVARQLLGHGLVDEVGASVRPAKRVDPGRQRGVEAQVHRLPAERGASHSPFTSRCRFLHQRLRLCGAAY